MWKNVLGRNWKVRMLFNYINVDFFLFPYYTEKSFHFVFVFCVEYIEMYWYNTWLLHMKEKTLFFFVIYSNIFYLKFWSFITFPLASFTPQFGCFCSKEIYSPANIKTSLGLQKKKFIPFKHYLIYLYQCEYSFLLLTCHLFFMFFFIRMFHLQETKLRLHDHSHSSFKRKYPNCRYLLQNVAKSRKKKQKPQKSKRKWKYITEKKHIFFLFVLRTLFMFFFFIHLHVHSSNKIIFVAGVILFFCFSLFVSVFMYFLF